MADTIKGKIEEAGHKIAETATKVGHKIGENVEEAADFVKEKAHQLGNRASEAVGSTVTTTKIQERMDVIGSCGNKLGVVDHVLGNQIKLTKNDSPDGQHHLIPTSWVDHVDSHVHLSKNCGEAKAQWGDA